MCIIFNLQVLDRQQITGDAEVICATDGKSTEQPPLNPKKMRSQVADTDH